MDLDFLAGAATELFLRDLADQQQERCRVLFRAMNRDRGIGRAFLLQYRIDSIPPFGQCIRQARIRPKALMVVHTEQNRGQSPVAASNQRVF